MDNIAAQVQQARLRYGIIGNDPALNADIERAVRVAPIDLSVLISGESGTGKEFFPRIIHDFSPRKHNRYIAVNCGAIPEGTIESELFGHEKGSFTGAISSRKGYFEEADGGTVFLDEVAELPLTTQARLLRVLETGEFLKVGSSTVQHTNVRIVAATNVDLLKAIHNGKFREDLYYRLSTVQIPIPPLRNRGNDVYLLAVVFANSFAERYSMPPISFTDDARRVMTAYRWPGNVRQLKNVIEQMSLFEAGKEITGEIFMKYLPVDYTLSGPPATLVDSDSSRYEREREMLLGMLMNMQHEIENLKKQLESSQVSPIRITNSTVIPADNLNEDEITPAEIISTAPITTPTDVVRYDSPSNPQTHISSLAPDNAQARSLEDTEKETILRALERNRGKRKATAAELKISERTLYRKIKEYNLE